LLDNNNTEARNYHYQLLKTVDWFYIDGNPSGVKEALYSLGLCASNQVRLPLIKMELENARLLRDLLQQTLDNKK